MVVKVEGGEINSLVLLFRIRLIIYFFKLQIKITSKVAVPVIRPQTFYNWGNYRSIILVIIALIPDRMQTSGKHF